MVEDLVNVLKKVEIESAPSSLRRAVGCDVDAAIQKHTEILEGIKSGRYKLASEIDKYK